MYGSKNYGERGIVAGGYSDATFNSIEYITISINGNSIYFGDLTRNKYNSTGSSNGSKGIICEGDPTGSGFVADKEYIVFSVLSNSIAVSDLTIAKKGSASCSNSTVMVVGGGLPAESGNLYSIQFATYAQSTSLGTLSINRYNLAGCSNSSIGLFFSGYIGSAYSNVIDYITFSQLSNAVDFGDSLMGSQLGCSCASDTRAIYQMGYPYGSNDLQYSTFATNGNAIAFGNLTHDDRGLDACSNNVYGIFAGGVETNKIEKITISTLANAVSFGNLILHTTYTIPTSCSGD